MDLKCKCDNKLDEMFQYQIRNGNLYNVCVYMVLKVRNKLMELETLLKYHI